MTEYSNSATLQLLGLGTRMLRWARGAIDALAADLAGGIGAGNQEVLIAVDARRTVVSAPAAAGRRTVLAESANDKGLPAPGFAARLPARARRDVALRVGEGKAIVSRLVLPAAAVDVLPAIVRNKVESLAPWPLAEAVWGYRAVPQQAPGQAVVDVGIVSRRTLADLLGALAAEGLTVNHLEIAGPRGDDPGIPVDFRAGDRIRRARWMIAAALAVLALIAVAVAGYGAVLAAGANADAKASEERIALLQQALQGRRGGPAASPQLAAANQLFERKRGSRPLVALLDDLSRLMPDSAWLTALSYDGARLTLTGHGRDAPQLVEILERSQSFADVNFAAATQRDPQGQGETFSLSTGLRGKAATP